MPEPAGEASHDTKGLVRLLYGCNERCTFCNVPAEAYRGAAPTLDELLARVDAFAARGERTLTLSGGEPTLRPRVLLALVRHARDRGIPFVELQTNATRVDPGLARDLAAAGLTSAFVSLLSHRAELHDALYGRAGAWVDMICGLDALDDAGIALTLNPVLARDTAVELPVYIDFVGERFPNVRAVSLSAVQPHGRGTAAEMPDYAVLQKVVPYALERARVHGIRVVNPYCGLPACVGWSHDLAHSVEATEPRLRAAVDPGRARHERGVFNQGDKVHGPPCARCALRPRCNGAWRAYWSERGGSGIAPPALISPPWAGEAGPLQSLLPDASEPTVWARAESLEAGAAAALLASECTDLALSVDVSGLALAPSPALLRTLQQVRDLASAARQATPRDQLRLHVRTVGGAEADRVAATEWFTGVGVALYRA